MGDLSNLYRRIYLSPFCRTLENSGMIIVGNILEDGKWIKIPSEIWKYIKESVGLKKSVFDILELCESDSEKRFYDDLLKKLFMIRVLTFDLNDWRQNVKNLYIDLTSRCNLHCEHCCSSYGDIPAHDLSFEQLIQLVKWADTKNIESITLTGGEIYILKDVNEKIKYTRNHFSGKISIITNGTLITDSDIDILKECINNVSISLDGYDLESVERIRGKHVFEKVMRLIPKLKEKGIEKISLSMVLVRENKEHREKFLDLCEKLEVKPMLRVLNPAGRARKKYSEFKVYDTYNQEFEALELEQIRNNVSMRVLCGAGMTTMSCSANGYIQPCTVMENKEYCMGTIEDLVNDRLKSLDIICGGVTDKVLECRNCNVRYFCEGTCRGMNETIYLDEELRSDKCRENKHKLEKAIWG
mgnify:CR=1 FL=1